MHRRIRTACEFSSCARPADYGLMLALSIRQPFAELILRGIETVEYRTRATRIVGERFHIYASKSPALRRAQDRLWSRDLSMAGDPPAWLIDLAMQVKLIEPGTILPTTRALCPLPSALSSLYHPRP